METQLDCVVHRFSICRTCSRFSCWSTATPPLASGKKHSGITTPPRGQLHLTQSHSTRCTKKAVHNITRLPQLCAGLSPGESAPDPDPFLRRPRVPSAAVPSLISLLRIIDLPLCLMVNQGNLTSRSCAYLRNAFGDFHNPFPEPSPMPSA
jgi:hypothetical protein